MRAMKIQAGYGGKQPARILTVDKGRRRVECALKDGGVVYAAVWELPVVFRWPKTGEVWMLRQDTGIWRLDSLVEDYTHLDAATSLADLAEGEARILTAPSESGSGLVINRHHAGRVKSFTIGNGSDTTFTLEHGLGTLSVDIELQDLGTGVHCVADYITVDENNIRVEFGIAPTQDQYRVTFCG